MDEHLLNVENLPPFRNTHSPSDIFNSYKAQVINEEPESLTTKNAVKFLLEGSLKFKVCRFCLNIDSPLSELDEIFEVARKGAIYKVTLRDMIACVHPAKITSDPNFPDKACKKCVDSAISSYFFSQQCEKSERALRNCFNDIHEKFEKLDPLERTKKKGRHKKNPNHNVLYAEHKRVEDYAEPVINIINLGASNSNDTQISELECPKCWQVLPDVESLLNHESMHPNTMWFSCRLCGQSFVKRLHYKKHVRDIHVQGNKYIIPETENTNFKCNECGIISDGFGEHLQHMEKHKFKATLECVLERNLDSLCAVCLEKDACMVHLNEPINLHGGYPELNNERTIFSIVNSTLPEISKQNYMGTQICGTCLDHAIASYVFVTKVRHVRNRLNTCISVMLDQLNEISDCDKNIMIEISKTTILPEVKDEFKLAEIEDGELDESKFEVDVLEDEFREKSSESGSESEPESLKMKYDVLSTLDEPENYYPVGYHDDHTDIILENPAKNAKNTYVNKKLVNGYQPFIQNEDDSMNDVCEFLTFKKKRKRYRRSYKCKFTCPYCSKHFISDYFLKKHVVKHVNVKTTCKLCGIQFKSKFYLYEHVKMIHLMKEKYYSSCKDCGRTFNSTQKMKMHEKRHKIKECLLCDKYFISQKYFNIHMQRHAVKLNMLTDWRVQTCSFCEKECTNENELSLHVNKAHLQIKPYSCDMCDRLFYTEYDLKNHKKIHSLFCQETCEFCSKSFKCRRSLVIHVRKHLGSKPHVCLVCKQSFFSENRMKRHMVIYHGGRFCCRLCKTVLPTRCELRTHISIEHNAM